jgi:hypothetical protein
VASAAAPPTTPAPPPSADLGLYLPKERAGGFTSCFDPDSAALRAIDKADRIEPTHAFPSAALADDLRDFKAALQKRYPGYAELAQDPGWDVDRYFADWEAGIRAAGPTVTFEEGVLRPFVGLRVQHRDNHLMPWKYGIRLTQRPELVLSEYQARRAFEPRALAACTFGEHAPIAGTLRVSRELGPHGVVDVAVLTAHGTADAIDATCGSETVRFERRPAAPVTRKDGAPVYEWHPAGDAAVIVVRELDGTPEALATLEHIAADYDAHRANKTLVFDFRGNGGGNDGYIHAWIEKAVRGTWRGAYSEVKVTGAELPCGEWNDLVLRQIDADTVDRPAAKDERDAAMQAALAKLRGASVQRFNPTLNTTTAAHPYPGRVFAIVDRDSGSSGESGPDMLRAAMGATIVGERSAGFLEYGNIRPWIMPRTGIGWWMPSKRNYYPGPRDAVGLPVDVYLAPELLGKPADELVAVLEAMKPRK